MAFHTIRYEGGPDKSFKKIRIFFVRNLWFRRPVWCCGEEEQGRKKQSAQELLEGSCHKKRENAGVREADCDEMSDFGGRD